MKTKAPINDIYEDRKIPKPWGNEVIFIPDYLNYTFKLLKIKKGCRISLQSHTQKRETFVLVSGEAKLTTGSSLKSLKTIKMKPYRGYTITINTLHRISATNSDVIIIEGSTKERGLTVRYQDDYNRPDETEQLRKSKNRGWNQKNK